MITPPLRNLARLLQIRFCNRSYSSSSSLGPRFLVEECGIPLKLTSSLTQNIQFEEKASANVKSVIAFFKSHEFSEAEVAKLIEKDPLIIHSRISTNLNPKLKYLIDCGFKGPLLRHVVVLNPGIFSKSLSSTIMRTHEYLKTVLESEESALLAIYRSPLLLTVTTLEKRMRPNFEYLAKQGMPKDRLVKFARRHTMVMMRGNDKMVNWVEKVKGVGVMPCDPMFMHVLGVVVTIGESTWKRKVELFKSLGWSDADVAYTFAKSPSCFSMSEARIRTMMNFFVNHMGVAREVIVAQPLVLNYSFKDRVMPRCGIVKLLEAKKLLTKWSLCSFIVLTEEKFIRKYITKNLGAVPHLLEAYHRSKKSGLKEISDDQCTVMATGSR